MALDLFVNFERRSNSSVFYRSISQSYTSLTIKLSDLQDPELPLGLLYNAKISFNGGESSLISPTSADQIETQVYFDTASPCVCSIRMDIYDHVWNDRIIHTFEMSGVFVKSLPKVDFIAYPQNYISSTNTISSIRFREPHKTPGVFFYGEGHTEQFWLSAGGGDYQGEAIWFIGNNETGIIQPTYLQGAPYEAKITVPSTPGLSASYPISVLLTNSKILSTAPIITYSDEDGAPRYYSYYASSVDLNGNEVERTTTKGNIQVLTYPKPKSPILWSPFKSDLVTLPVDRQPQTFTTYITNPGLSGFVRETFVGTSWDIQTIHDSGMFLTERNETTPLLPEMIAYQFQLAYDQPPEELVLPYYISPYYFTTFTLTVTSHSIRQIVLPPYDWTPVPTTIVNTLTATIAPISFVKIYSSNFYHLTGQPVLIEISDIPKRPLFVERMDITSSQTNSVITLSSLSLSSGPLSGSMVFSSTGSVDLEVNALVKNTTTGETQEISITYPNSLEIVSELDVEPNEKYFRSALTPFIPLLSSHPRISPNDWASADNVNSVISKLHESIEQLVVFTKLYEQKGELYSWIGVLPPYNYTWQDGECPSNTILLPTWADFELETNNNLPLKTWESNFCYKDPFDCKQKYCIDWNWKSRKNEDYPKTTWRSTKSEQTYEKRWRYEKCETDSMPVNCSKSTWKVRGIDPTYFPIPSYIYSPRCKLVDARFNLATNHMLLAYNTEIQLCSKDSNCTVLSRNGTADSVYSFQNITGIATNNSNKVAVLDAFLSRVVIFNIQQNKLERITNWGSYGSKLTPLGFKQPQDIHIDQNNYLWITDTGNGCVKCCTINGKWLSTNSIVEFDEDAPISSCVDSQNNLHVLTKSGMIYGFDSDGFNTFSYQVPDGTESPKKINVSANREIIYITHSTGVLKYFRNGNLCLHLIDSASYDNGTMMTGYQSVYQDENRNVYITIEDKVLKVPDLQILVEQKSAIANDLYWPVEDILIHKEEYIQPWVYLKCFHRLWDNIELLRGSLFYEQTGCKSYSSPIYQKKDLIIGQNEFVSNSVINRLSEQLWKNLEGLIKYFKPNC